MVNKVGKPFSTELSLLKNTFDWCNKAPVGKLSTFINKSRYSSLVAIGSGGSSSACNLAALLHQKHTGMLSKATTPLEIHYFLNTVYNSSVIFISAGGKNNDILSSFNEVVQKEPGRVLSICMKEKSELGRLSQDYSVTDVIEYDLPSGKDGFLATNSLLAYFSILSRAYGTEIGSYEKIGPSSDFLTSIQNFLEKINDYTTFSVLYGGWGQPVAIDLESKFTEAALGNLHISDYRNFGHGRHHWFAKKGSESVIIALISKDEVPIATKTLALLPKEIPKLILASESSGPLASIELLVKSFYLVNYWGYIRSIDPGRPGVPEFGSKLYRLKYTAYYKGAQIDLQKVRAERAIIKKTNVRSINQLSDAELKGWYDAYQSFIERFNRQSFGGIAFDYDGTLCSIEDRCTGISHEIKNEIDKILTAGFIVSIITGRGKSVRESLQKQIEKKYWDQVIIGYYNGSDIAFLYEDEKPSVTNDFDQNLIRLENSIVAYEELAKLVSITSRPKQLTIESNNTRTWDSIKNLVSQCIAQLYVPDVKILVSSHSIDVIPITESKLKAVDFCSQIAIRKGLPANIICIGDKGLWPGNDYQLLSTPYSLSVDEVSSDPNSCWNLNEPSQRNTNATLCYLLKLYSADNCLKIQL